MIEIKSYVGELEILASGQAHLILGQTLKLVFPHFKIELSYENDNDNESKIDWENKNNLLTVVFRNYTKKGGSGIVEPWEIGTYQGRKLFMSFFADFHDDGEPNFLLSSYIFYLGKEVKNG